MSIVVPRMLSDDVFRAKRSLTIAELSAWTGFVADVAHVEYGETDGGWRINMMPRIPNGCPVELLLRDDQHYDVRIASQTYEDRPVDKLDMFLALLKAIADGHVITRRTRSAMTGAAIDIETIVRIADLVVFHGRQGLDGRTAVAAGRTTPPPLPSHVGGVEISDTHYVPYRRGDGV